jgi:quercetin dioxygenase-like cupin family protein
MEKLDIKCIISGDETHGKMAVFEEIVAPGSGPPRHTHRNQLEIFHVIEGSLQFEVNGESFERKAGAAAVVPAGVVHAFRNIGATPAVIHFELLPAGDSEEAFELMVRGEIDDVDAFFDKYGMDLAGPPLT